MDKEEKQKYIHEIKTQCPPSLNTKYYCRNVDKYVEDREIAFDLFRFLMDPDKIKRPMLRNERSSEIFGHEKYLTNDGKGTKVLSHFGVKFDDIPAFLNIRESYEPIPHFTIDRHTPQTMLVIENKEPFCSIRELLIEGQSSIFGHKISTLLYGGGRHYETEFVTELEKVGEPCILDENNTILYFGDLDYVGIDIYDSFKNNRENVIPFVEAYRLLLKCSYFPKCEKNQSPCDVSEFLSHFHEDEQEKIKEILEDGRYAPQEFLNYYDYKE